METEYLSKLDELLSLMTQLVNNKGKNTIATEWVSVSTVAQLKGLTPDAIRKKLQNGDYEEGLHFRYIGSRIQVHQGAIEQIQRDRRSSNG